MNVYWQHFDILNSWERSNSKYLQFRDMWRMGGFVLIKLVSLKQIIVTIVENNVVFMYK